MVTIANTARRIHLFNSWLPCSGAASGRFPGTSGLNGGLAMETEMRMRNYSGRGGKRFARAGLTDDLLYGMTPDEFGDEAKALSEASALSPAMRERLKHQLVERLKTSVDPPSWGPDWVRRWNKSLAKTKPRRSGWFSRK